MVLIYIVRIDFYYVYGVYFVKTEEGRLRGEMGNLSMKLITTHMTRPVLIYIFKNTISDNAKIIQCSFRQLLEKTTKP